MSYDISTFKTLVYRALTRFGGHTQPNSWMKTGYLKNRLRSTKVKRVRCLLIFNMYIRHEIPTLMNLAFGTFAIFWGHTPHESGMTSSDLKNRSRSTKINRFGCLLMFDMYVRYEISTLLTLACTALTRFGGHTQSKHRMTSGDLKNRQRSINMHRKAPIVNMYVKYELSTPNTKVMRATDWHQ